MSETLTQIRDRLRGPRPSTPVPVPELSEVTEKAFVINGPHRTVITGPASVGTWEKAAAVNRGFDYLAGRYVEADKANRNGAYWSTGDLELGQPTVAGGPLNWLHEEKTIIGALLDSKLVYAGADEIGTERAGESIGTHIQALAAVWRFLHPEKAAALAKFSHDKQLWLSMECVSQHVECVQGCGETFTYSDWMNDRSRVCAHLQAGGTRRFVDPVFLGSAVIVPPVRPGWGNATAEVLRQAASVTEANTLGEGSVSKAEAQAMVAAIVTWAHG